MATCQSDAVNSLAQDPAKSRRAILTGAVAALAAAPALASSPDSDPIYPVWREWRSLEEEAARLSVASNEAWDAMPNWARHPCVLVLEGRDYRGNLNGNKFYADSVAEIRQFFDHAQDRRATPAQRAASAARMANLEAKLLAASDAAEAEQERCGYAAINRRWDEVIDEQSALIDRIEATPSRSPVALAAKIDIAFGMSRKEGWLSDYPHCIYCSIVRAVYHELPIDMQAALARAATLDGKVGELYWRGAQS